MLTQHNRIFLFFSEINLAHSVSSHAIFGERTLNSQQDTPVKQGNRKLVPSAWLPVLWTNVPDCAHPPERDTLPQLRQIITLIIKKSHKVCGCSAFGA